MTKKIMKQFGALKNLNFEPCLTAGRFISSFKFRISDFKKIKGVSLPLVTGLVTLLMISSAAANQLIIRSLRSVQRIEASNRAYMAAEAGIEDALYEITPHFAGYQTPVLGDNQVRNIDFQGTNLCDEGDNEWCTEWTVESRSGISGWSGRFYENQKLVTYLYNDTNFVTPSTNAINTTAAAADISMLNVSTNFSITFQIPDYGTIFGGDTFKIDADEDNLVNEDGPSSNPLYPPNPIFCPQNPEDNDCDGKVDEDSDEDTIILWRLTDGTGKSLIPLKGCLSDSAPPADARSEICEKDFLLINDYSATLSQDTWGQNEFGEEEQIETFLRRIWDEDAVHDEKITFEFLVVVALEHVVEFPVFKKIEIPYLDYTVNSGIINQIPYPYFTIKSDGYFRGFKQSITSTVTPKTTVPLFDFTIIQQQ